MNETAFLAGVSIVNHLAERKMAARTQTGSGLYLSTMFSPVIVSIITVPVSSELCLLGLQYSYVYTFISSSETQSRDLMGIGIILKLQF